MEDPLEQFSGQYQQGLKDCLEKEGEGPLHSAYELGRSALSDGIGILDIVVLHQAALEAALKEGEAESRDALAERVRTANRFLAEVLSPFEITLLSSKDANAALRRLYDVVEAEAKRIAHMLHDESAQMLAMVYLELDDIARNASPEVKQRISQVVSHLDEVREQLRRLSHEIRPLILDQLGLGPALSFLANGVKKRTGLDVQVRSGEVGRLSQTIETVLYRTVQEALTNVARHANAERVEVKTWIEKESNSVFCVVTDDGQGFKVPDGAARSFRGLGLVGMRERVTALNGNFTITSSPGEGTTIQVAIPL